MDVRYHVALANWLRDVTLAVLAAQGVNAPAYAERYTWDGDWFCFAYGLSGCDLFCPESRPAADVAAYAEGLRLRGTFSADVQQALDDLQIACPSYPGDTAADAMDLEWLRDLWGPVTEIATDVGMAPPPEIEALVAEEP